MGRSVQRERGTQEDRQDRRRGVGGDSPIETPSKGVKAQQPINQDIMQEGILFFRSKEKKDTSTQPITPRHAHTNTQRRSHEHTLIHDARKEGDALENLVNVKCKKRKGTVLRDKREKGRNTTHTRRTLHFTMRTTGHILV